MGGRAGGGAGGGMGSRSRSAMRASTEKGYSDTLQKAVLGKEAGIRTDKMENAFAITKDGRVVYSAKGDKDSVYINTGKIKDAVVTHNHPSGNGKGLKSLGTSFSADDIGAAIQGNASEVRVVTKNYTYSLKRPKGGWGVSASAAESRFGKLTTQHVVKNFDYVSKYKGDMKTAKGRLTQIANHVVVKQMAKEFGWSYTWKKG